MTPNDITDHLYTARGHANRLAQSVSSGGRLAEEAWPEVIEELQTALEELTVAEEELHEQNDALLGARLEIEVERQRFRDLFDSAPVAYIVTNIHGVILQANHAAAHLLNVSRPYLEGKPLVNFLPNSERRDFRSALLMLEREGGRREWKVMLLPRDATDPVHTVFTGETALPDEGLAPTVRWIVRDITEQVTADEAIRALNAQLEQRVAERTADLEAANQRMQRLLRTERQARLRAERLEALHVLLGRVDRLLGAPPGGDGSLGPVAEALAESAYTGCEIALFEDSGARIAARAGVPNTHAAPPGDRPGADESLSTRRARRTLWVDTEKRERVALVAPLMAREHPMGLLFLRTAESQVAPDETDIWFAEEAARRCGLALCAARLFAPE